MTLAQFWSTLTKQWQIILICIVVVVAGAYAKAKITKPVYQATALVQVATGNGSTNLDDLLANNQLVQTEVVLATAHPVLSQVVLKVPGISESDLAASVTASVKTNAQVIEIDVQNTDPERAVELANAIANELIDQQNQLQLSSVRHDNVKPTNFLLHAQEAVTPTIPVQPDSKLYLELGLAGGVLLGILLAMLFQLLDKRIRTTKDLAQEISWPLLTAIRRFKETEQFTDPAWQSANVEAYNVLRTMLAFLPAMKSQCTILVTSPTQQDGKSTVAANLAVTMAKTGKKTLLVDANLRNPSLYEKFNLPIEKAGLSNAIFAFVQDPSSSSLSNRQQFITNQPSLAGITNQPSLDAFMYTVGVPNLRIIPSGPLPPNPSELLSSKAMDAFYKALVNHGAELIILDTPALLGLSDTSALLSKVDGMLLVVDIMRADKRKLSAVKNLLSHVDIQVLGCIVNKLKHQEFVITQNNATEKNKSVGQSFSSGRMLAVQSPPSLAAVAALQHIPAQEEQNRTAHGVEWNGHVK